MVVQLILSRNCTDTDNTHEVSLALESEQEETPADDPEHSHAKESSSGEITEVSNCHAQGDVQYCVAGGEEWELTTDVDTENAPDSYSGCHAYGEDELSV